MEKRVIDEVEKMRGVSDQYLAGRMDKIISDNNEIIEHLKVPEGNGGRNGKVKRRY